MSNGKIIYPSGDPAAVTYNFVKNYDYGIRIGYLDTDDYQRGFDGTLNSYAGASKKTYDLTFSYAQKTQFDYFMALWALHCSIDLYLDGTTLDATVKMMGPPVGEAKAAFYSAGVPTWSFTVRFEEI